MAVINNPPVRQSTVSAIINGVAGIMPNSWTEWVNQVYIVCFSVQQSGLTAERPTVNLWTGRPYFDTTLGKPIWYKTTGWVDATGAAV